MCKLVLLWYPIYHGGFLHSLLFFVPLFFLMDNFKSPSYFLVHTFFSSAWSVLQILWLFFFIYCILQFQNFHLVLFHDLYHCWPFVCVLFPWFFWTLYYNSISFLKIVILISSVKSKLPMTLASVTKRLCDLWWFHVSLIFHVLEVLYCCVHFWSSSYLFQPL